MLTLAVSSCSERNLPSEEAIARAGAFAAEVETERVWSDVLALVQAHREDTPLDCSRLNLPDPEPALFPGCHLTRDLARKRVRERFEALGFTVTTQDSPGPDFASSNIIAELRGTERPGEVVLIGAHYDAFHSGADDNSSGVAAMLELARLVSGRKFARTVRFVGFDLEEMAITGSVRYLKARPDENPMVAVIFDCIGFRDTRPNSQLGVPGFPVPTTGDFVAAIANEQSRPRLEELLALQTRLKTLPVSGAVAPGSGPSPLAGDLLRSDHSAFWFAGRNALFLTDTANLRNPNYHLDTDVPETLDPRFLADVTRVTAAALSYWAEGPLP
jgi:hypothetical protein